MKVLKPTISNKLVTPIIVFAIALGVFTILPLGTVQAYNVEYSTVLGIKSPDILIQYYGVGKKQNYLCSTTSLSCRPTKQHTLGTKPANNIDDQVEEEMTAQKADHLLMSPSGDYLAYYIAGTDAAPSRVFKIRNVKSGKEYSLSTSISYWDLVDDQKKVFDFSPDSTKIIYLDDKDGAPSLYIVDTTKFDGPTIASTKLGTVANQIDGFLFTDNDTIYYIGNDKSNSYIWSLHKYSISSGKDIVEATNVSYVDPIIKVGHMLVFNHLEQKGFGPEVWNLNNNKLSHFKVPGINSTKNIIHQEVVQTGDVTGVLMTPTKSNTTKTYPLLIWLHGGPYRQTSYGYHPYHSYGLYDGILELLRKNNVVVLKLDYPGSFGLGTPYAESIKGSVGKIDVDNVMAAIAYAKNLYHINNVYLAGNSYGGYLALRTLVEHPDSLTAVGSINGVTDWQSLLERMKTSIFNTDFNGLPNASNQNLYDQASIANKIGNIGNQKINIIAGMVDRTIPYWQATDLYAKLKDANKNVSLISYPGEDHVYAKKKTLVDLCIKMFNLVNIKVDPGCK